MVVPSFSLWRKEVAITRTFDFFACIQLGFWCLLSWVLMNDKNLTTGQKWFFSFATTNTYFFYMPFESIYSGVGETREISRLRLWYWNYKLKAEQKKFPFLFNLKFTIKAMSRIFEENTFSLLFVIFLIRLIHRNRYVRTIKEKTKIFFFKKRHRSLISHRRPFRLLYGPV